MNSGDEELWTAHRQIEECLDRDRLDHANKILARVMPNYPDDRELTFFAGYIAWRQDDLDDASQHIERRPRTDPARRGWPP